MCASCFPRGLLDGEGFVIGFEFIGLPPGASFGHAVGEVLAPGDEDLGERFDAVGILGVDGVA